MKRLRRSLSILRGRFPRVVCTEYAADEAALRWLFPIPGEDICKLSFPDNCLHAVVSGDVLEHVPDIDAALREIARVLKPGGRFLGTFPFISSNKTARSKPLLSKGKSYITASRSITIIQLLPTEGRWFSNCRTGRS